MANTSDGLQLFLSSRKSKRNQIQLASSVCTIVFFSYHSPCMYKRSMIVWYCMLLQTRWLHLTFHWSPKTDLHFAIDISRRWRNIFTNGLFSQKVTFIYSPTSKSEANRAIELGAPSNLRLNLIFDTHGRDLAQLDFLKLLRSGAVRRFSRNPFLEISEEAEL